MKRILTGLQPTGVITLGNYIGAIKQMVKYQQEYESYIFIADMHSLTIPQDPTVLKNNIRSLLALYIACGIDPDKNTIFIQSENEYHANISWMLECTTPYGELTRMTQFKDKSSKRQSFSAGLLTYPVLMAADILIYDVDYVPVGIDQKQHVELARNIADSFNKKYGETFKIPEPLITKTGTKIMDLQDPTKKMSKSSFVQSGVIKLLDDEETIKKKVMGAVTDTNKIKKDDPANPDVCMVYYYHKLVNNEENLKTICSECKKGARGCVQCKKELIEAMNNFLKPIQERRKKYEDNPELVQEILDKGTKEAKAKAEETMKKVKEAMMINY